MSFNIENINGRDPLIDFPWRSEVDRLLDWVKDKDSHIQAFCFDVVMSAAYIDATSGLERYLESCENISIGEYNSHLGFINLCSPCYCSCDIWQYQKAVKPQSGAIGKLSSEVILRFVEKLYPELSEVIAIGGTESADALLKHKNGMTILAEVKSAPLLTFPFIFSVNKSCLNENHEKITITSSQLNESNSAIYLHNENIIELGKVGGSLWPFKPLIDFITDDRNINFIETIVGDWIIAKDAYKDKDKNNKMYYLANASGKPPKLARERDSWPKRESISDSKTSAGMDRTDDIKKGIYQSLKIGTQVKDDNQFKTAIISNLPAYRHGDYYVSPFIDMYWGLEKDLIEVHDDRAIMLKDLRRAFDFVITLEEPILRNISL